MGDYNLNVKEMNKLNIP